MSVDSKEEKVKQGQEETPAMTAISEKEFEEEPNGQDNESQEKKQSKLLIFPTNENTYFPNIIAPLHLKRKAEFTFFKKAHENKQAIGIIATKKGKRATKKSDLYSIGATVNVIKLIHLPTGHGIVLLEGQKPFKLLDVEKKRQYFEGSVTLLEDKPFDITKKSNQALISSLKELTLDMLDSGDNRNSDLRNTIESLKSPILIIHSIAVNIAAFRIRQRLLTIRDIKKRAELILQYLLEGRDFNKLKAKIQHKLHQDISKEQREVFIRKQIKAWQEELNESDEDNDILALTKRARQKKWPQAVKKHFEETIEQLRNLPFHNPEYANILRYVNLLLDLPWGVYTEDKRDLAAAQTILEKSHFGMEKVKERLLEFLAVHTLKKGASGVTICLAGPPGVGKTTIAKAIAQALGRQFIKISLAGMHDEAKLLGHARTYVSSKQGAIISGLKQARTANPVILLDEIDKMDYLRSLGPESILPMLDPSQQKEFKDNYLEVPFDISQVLFIATANDLSKLSWPLYDRLEVIELEGYATEEKIEIAQQYLIPKAQEVHGLQPQAFHLTTNALQTIIQEYTSESGVRDLYRQISTICRKIAKANLTKQPYTKNLQKSHVHKMLGTPKYDEERNITIEAPGKALGLSWSRVGGSVLPIEASAHQGKGNITLSGQLGKVMQESAHVALSLIKSQADNLKIDHRIFKEYDLHIHSGPGSVSKEGPSAGITLAAAMASLYAQRKIKNKVAMTGEITLQGKVCPVGGIKEKILAAKRSGIESIILSKDNKKHVDEIKKKYLQGLSFHYVDTVGQAFEYILEAKPVHNPKQWAFSAEKNTNTTPNKL